MTKLLQAGAHTKGKIMGPPHLSSGDHEWLKEI